MGKTLQITFEELYRAFMEEKKVRTRGSTYLGYDVIGRHYLLPYFEGIPLESISPADVRKWQNELIGLGKSDQYIKRINTALVSVFNYGMRFYELERNPAVLAGSIGKYKRPDFGIWTLTDYERFRAEVKSTELRLAFDILYWTGLRLGELLALTIGDIDLNEKYPNVAVNKSLSRYHGNDIISPPKTQKGNRTVYIHPLLAEEIKNYIEIIRSIEDSNEKRLFEFTREPLKNEIDRISELLGLRRIRIHDLRHSHASLLIEMNVTPLLISERLGHESVQTTLDIYSHLYPNKQKELSIDLQAMAEKKSL